MTQHVGKAGKVDPGDRVKLPVEFACKPRGFNKHRQPTKCVGYFAQSSRLLFSPKKKQLVLKMLWTKDISLNLN